MKKLLALLLFVVSGVSIAMFYQKEIKTTPYIPPHNSLDTGKIYQGLSYKSPKEGAYAVEQFTNNVSSPTRIVFTPDGEYMLVAMITGEVVVYPRDNGVLADSPYLLTQVETKAPGFPPREAGLTGIVTSSLYDRGGNLFLLYSYMTEDKKILNRVAKVTVRERWGRLRASKPEVIFEANIPGNESHQITDGVGVEIDGVAHLMFVIGEGFEASRAEDPRLEAGKVILIKEDGSTPEGIRPYEENSKVEAIGLRNAYVIARGADNKYLIADTGPSRYDRLIYTALALGDGVKLNLGWDGSEERLAGKIPDSRDPQIPDIVALRLPETQTFTGLVYDPKSQDYFATLFGQTGSLANSPGKEIWRIKLNKSNQGITSEVEPIVKRRSEAEGKLGNPIGLAIDPVNGELYFADILENRIYKITKIGR